MDEQVLDCLAIHLDADTMLAVIAPPGAKAKEINRILKTTTAMLKHHGIPGAVLVFPHGTEFVKVRRGSIARQAHRSPCSPPR